MLTKHCAQSLNKSFAFWPNLSLEICNKLLPTRSSSATVTTSTSFELASFHVRVTSIKSTKQELVRQWVIESVSDKGKQWSDSGLINIAKFTSSCLKHIALLGKTNMDEVLSRKGSFPKAFKSRVHCAFGNVLEEGHICYFISLTSIQHLALTQMYLWSDIGWRPWPMSGNDEKAGQRKRRRRSQSIGAFSAEGKCKNVSDK